MASEQVRVSAEELESARRAFERGRARWAASRAALFGVVCAAVGLALFGGGAMALAPVPFLACGIALYRGGALQAGFGRGALAGVVSLLMPLSILRPCCAAGMAGASCCAAPSMCTVYGALLGGAFALLLPRARGWRGLEAAAGLILGVAAMGALRCEAMLVGETLGILAGVAAGCAALTTARAALG
jgi:hypothetical protein